MNRRCYIARYPVNAEGTDLAEEILVRDTFYSPHIAAEWDRLVSERHQRIALGSRVSAEPMLQCWYSDADQVRLMAATNQPFRLL